jgi:hypothetical protein
MFQTVRDPSEKIRRMNRLIQQHKLMPIAIGCGEQVGSRGLS